MLDEEVTCVVLLVLVRWLVEPLVRHHVGMRRKWELLVDFIEIGLLPRVGEACLDWAPLSATILSDAANFAGSIHDSRR